MKVCAEDKKIANNGENSFKRMAGNASVRKALLIGVMLQFFQQLAGINTGNVKIYLDLYIHNSNIVVIYYSARILQMSGISNSVSTILWISCGVNAINFFSSFIGKFHHAR